MRDPGTGNVQVLFAGLMVGRLRDRMYELGRLPDHDHQLKVCYLVTGPGGHPPIKAPDIDGLVWELGIANPAGPNQPPDVEAFDPTEIDRQNPPDDENSPAYKSFRWLLDMEDGHDFPAHPPRTPPVSGSLHPLIYVRNGILYNRELTVSLHQQLKKGAIALRFGHASNILGVDMMLAPGQQIFLVKTAPTPTEEILRITVREGNEVRISVTNDPKLDLDNHPQSESRSHFHKYYKAFNVAERQQYDFWDLTEKLHSESEPKNSDVITTGNHQRPNSAETESGKRAPDTSVVGSGRAAFAESEDCGSGIPGPLCGTITLGRS